MSDELKARISELEQENAKLKEENKGLNALVTFAVFIIAVITCSAVILPTIIKVLLLK